MEQFVESAWQLLGGVKSETSRDGQKIIRFSFEDLIRKKYPGLEFPKEDKPFVFSLPVKSGQTCRTRTHPLVEQLTSWLAETALDPHGEKIISRSGVMRTKCVSRQTTLLVCRLRFQIITSGDIENTCLAEVCAALAFCGSPHNAEWLSEDDVPRLLTAVPAENVPSEQAAGWVRKVEDGINELMPHIEAYQMERASQLLNSHRKVRDASRRRNLRYRVLAQGKPDILGIFIYLPTIEV